MPEGLIIYIFILRVIFHDDIILVEIDSLFRLLFGREDMKDNIMNMVITEFNEEVFVKGIREEGRKEGREEGRKEREALEAENQMLKKELEELKLSINKS